MCGIVGFIDPVARGEAMDATVGTMADSLAHRGPDDRGTWTDPARGIALGHRRLSIIDLSDDGHQPMVSATGRFIIVFNGEVYNFVDLRRELEAAGHRFRGHSDTEIILGAIEHWGLESAVSRFIGMFAFALWDRTNGVLSLVRDRLGIKPLYCGWNGRTFLFASELKALRRHPGFLPNIDPDAVAMLLRYSYIPTPKSIYRGIGKLPPGHILKIDSDTPPNGGRLDCYWSVEAIDKNAVNDQFSGTAEDARDELDALLRDSVRLRMVSDVPLGVFLSGGIDSSTMVALMQA